MENSDTWIAIIMGICLSAACGFRVFLPLLAASLASRYDYLTLADGFAWLGTNEAVIILSAATLLEVCAYYIPWVDNLLDQVAAPAAMVAGTLLTASVLPDMSPVFKWALALIAGGGAAGAIQSTTTLTRQVSSVATGGMGNAALSTLELGGALFSVIIALFLPFVALFALMALLLVVLSRLMRRRSARAATI